MRDCTCTLEPTACAECGFNAETLPQSAVEPVVSRGPEFVVQARTRTGPWCEVDRASTVEEARTLLRIKELRPRSPRSWKEFRIVYRRYLDFAVDG